MERQAMIYGVAGPIMNRARWQPLRADQVQDYKRWAVAARQTERRQLRERLAAASHANAVAARGLRGRQVANAVRQGVTAAEREAAMAKAIRDVFNEMRGQS
jgi:hypothetical protein